MGETRQRLLATVLVAAAAGPACIKTANAPDACPAGCKEQGSDGDQPGLWNQSRCILDDKLTVIYSVLPVDQHSVQGESHAGLLGFDLQCKCDMEPKDCRVGSSMGWDCSLTQLSSARLDNGRVYLSFRDLQDVYPVVVVNRTEAMEAQREQTDRILSGAFGQLSASQKSTIAKHQQRVDAILETAAPAGTSSANAGSMIVMTTDNLDGDASTAISSFHLLDSKDQVTYWKLAADGLEFGQGPCSGEHQIYPLPH